MRHQQEVDYINDAQHRVSAETGVLEAKGVLTLLAGETQVALPADLTRLLAVYDGVLRLEQVQPLDYMLAATGSGFGSPGVLAWALVGRTLYFTSTPSSNHTLTIMYERRSGDVDSDSTLELTGEYERLVERLVGAQQLLDDGQPELAGAEMAQYEDDLRALRRRATNQHGVPSRMGLGRRTP